MRRVFLVDPSDVEVGDVWRMGGGSRWFRFPDDVGDKYLETKLKEKGWWPDRVDWLVEVAREEKAQHE